MRVSVFGLGYVGCVSAACLAARGHDVVGVDVNPDKVELIATGRPTVLESNLDELVEEAVRARKLRATTDAREAVAASELSLVSVGTPSERHGRLSTDALDRVSREIGAALADKSERHTVVFRSTMLPGTCAGVLVPALEESSNLAAGEGFGVAVNPEFLREGNGVEDFFEPSKIVVGAVDGDTADAVLELYRGLPGRVFRVSLEIAELTKYVDNAFHALKVGFANEIGALSRELGLDSHEVMEIFRSDTKLNISTAYLTPGFAFGGSCLPKDLRALVQRARAAGLSLPIVEHVLASNEEHMRRTIELVEQFGRRRIGIFGLAFKPGTDDLRESPLVELSERLLGKGYDLRIYDANVSLSRLTGKNRAFIEEHLPHIGELLSGSVEDVLEHAEVCIVGSSEPVIVDAVTPENGRIVIDLVRLPGADSLRGRPGYVGVGW
jgi:GDP-mannose 6-dehydrogenase